MTTLAANGHRISDRYTLLGKLGEGGESEVWRARDHTQGSEIALKVLRPELAQRPGSWETLERQHEISRQLEHPLILRIDPPVRDGDVVALPMELAPGGDLRRLCGVSYLEIVPVLMEVTQALAHAHERGVVHRDLKPGNVLFDARGHVRLADFGAAPLALSPFTASPQQLKGEPPAPADDIYGLGALAYELLSGHPPFYPNFDRRRVLEEPAPPLKAAHLAPGRLIGLVRAMLAKQPRERPASMRAVLETLDMALNDTLTFAYEESPSALAARELPPVAPEEDDAEPLVPPPPRVARQAHLERPVAPEGSQASEPLPALERPHAFERPRPPDRTPGIERRPAPERQTAPPPRPPLITPVPQASLPRHASPFASQQPAPPSQRTNEVPQPAQAPPQRASEAPPQHTPFTASAAPAPPLRAERTPEADLRALWGDIRVERMPSLMKLEPDHRSRWPWVLVAGIGVAAIALLILMRGSDGERAWVKPSVDQLRAMTPPAIERAVRNAVEAPLHAMHDGGLTAQQDAAGRGAPPSPNSTEAAPSSDATSHATPDQPQTTAVVPAPAPVAATPVPATPVPTPARQRTRTARVSTGSARAGVAGGVPTRSGPNPAAQRGRASPGLEPLLSDGRAAEAARDFSRAAQDYSQALALDPRNAEARAGLGRANAAFGAGVYSQAVGAGFAALGAGRLEEARENFQRARTVDPRGSEATQGLREVAAALRTRDAATERYRARSDLERRLQAVIDNPQQLGSAAVRAEAASLIREAEEMPSSGAVMRSLAARLAILLPAYDKPVSLALVSDNLTEIAIPQIGSFGTFSRRQIDLKPGKYTVIGTRAGYREVRRDVTVAPGQTGQTISVRCEVPI